MSNWKTLSLATATALSLALLAPSADAEPLPPSPTRVRVLPDGRMTLNGNPYFFVGTAPGPPLNLKTPEGRDGWVELAEGGISMLRSIPNCDPWTSETKQQLQAYFDHGQRAGIYVSPALRKLSVVNTPADEAQLRECVNMFKSHPALIIWKSADEPEWGKIPPEPLIRAAGIIRELDPNHPIYFAHAPRGTLESLRPYNAGCDILATDIYPVSELPGKHSLLPNKDISMVGDWTRRTVDLAARQKMVFMIIQVGWSGIINNQTRSNKVMFPTFRQERFMMYQAIINGANSIQFFGFPVQLYGRDAELGWNWTYWRGVVKPLLAEIKPGSELYPVLTSPDTTYPLTFTGAPQIETRWKEGGPYLYIFACARDGQRREAIFTGIENGHVEVLFENRSLNAANNAFTDTFEPHDVHIYRVMRIIPKTVIQKSEGDYYRPPGADTQTTKPSAKP